MRTLGHFHALIVSVGSSIILSGCATLQAQSRVDPRTIADYSQLSATGGTCIRPVIKGDSNSGVVNLDCLQFPDEKVTGKFMLAYAGAQGDPGKRNRLAAILLKQSDDVCTVEMGRLTADEAIVNTTLSIATSALSTASSIVSGDLAKSILSGGSSLTNATRGHVNSEVYRNALSTALTKAIYNERDRLRLTIQQHRAESTASYTVDDMIMDVNRYHQTCSFYRGLQLVVQAVDRGAPTVSGRYQALSTALSDLEAQIGRIDAQLTAMPAADDRRKSLTDQRAALVAKQTAILTERADLGTGAPPPGETAPDPAPAGGEQPEKK